MKQGVNLKYMIVPGMHLGMLEKFYGDFKYNRTVLPSVIMPSEIKKSSEIIKGQWVINRLYDVAKLLCLEEYLNGVSCETLMPVEEYVKAHYELVKDRIDELNVLIESLDSNFKKLDSRIEKLMVMDKIDSASSELEKISNYYTDAMKQYYEDIDALLNMKGAICFLKVYLSKLLRECASIEFVCRKSSEGSEDPYADGDMYSVMRNLVMRYKSNYGGKVSVPSIVDISSSGISEFECVPSGGSKDKSFEVVSRATRGNCLINDVGSPVVASVAEEDSVFDEGSSPGVVSVAAGESVGINESLRVVSVTAGESVFDDGGSPGAVSVAAGESVLDDGGSPGAVSVAAEDSVCEDGEGLARSCSEPEKDSNADDVFDNVNYSIQNNVSLMSAVCNVSVVLMIGEICWRLFYEWVLLNSVLVVCASVDGWDAGPPHSRVLRVLLAS